MIHKYKNEANNIPKFEKYLISKDRLKPCDNLTFYFDEGLARRFYQEFWDLVRDTQPVQEVERHITTEVSPERTPPNRPSSLIRPSQIGIPKIPIPREAYQLPKTRKGPTRKQPSSHSKEEGSSDSEDDSPKGPNKENSEAEAQSSEAEESEESIVENQYEDNNEEFLEENQNYGQFQAVPQVELREDERFLAQNRININLGQNQTEATPVRRTNNGPRLPAIEYQPQGRQQGTVYQRLPSRYPIQRPQPRLQQQERPTGATPKLVKSLPRHVWSVAPRKSLVMGVEGSDRIIVFNQPPQRKQTGPTLRNPSPTITNQHKPAPSNRQGTVVTAKSSKTKSTKTSKPKRMDPAVHEALTSKSNYFQDPEFDGLKEYYQDDPTMDVEQEIQDIADNMDKDFQQIEANIEDILAEDDDLPN